MNIKKLYNIKDYAIYEPDFIAFLNDDYILVSELFENSKRGYRIKNVHNLTYIGNYFDTVQDTISYFQININNFYLKGF